MKQKVQKLIQFAKQDTVYNDIVTNIESLGIDVSLTWFGKTGSYQPQALNLNNPEELEETIEQLKKNGHTHSTIKLSLRFGKWIMYHTFLHELYHAHQDSLGLFLIPLHINGKPQFSLDENSQRTITLFNEALAATESIRASYRLKENGYPDAWYGALLSPDWHKLARTYAKDIKNTNYEETAAKNLFNNWHNSHLKKYYEKKSSQPQTSKMELKDINYENLSALIPKTKRPGYLPQNHQTTLSNIKQGSISNLLHSRIKPTG